MSDNNNIFSIVKKEKSKIKVHLTYTDQTTDIVVCDEFVVSEVLPGFAEFWQTEPDKLLSMVNTSLVKTVDLEIINE